jgi:hypothetical protein
MFKYLKNKLANGKVREMSLGLIKHRATKTYGGMDVQLIAFTTSALAEGEWSASRPGRFTVGERAPGTHWIGGWVGPRASVKAVAKKKNPCPAGNRTPVVQPVAK